MHPGTHTVGPGDGDNLEEDEEQECESGRCVIVEQLEPIDASLDHKTDPHQE